MRKIDLTEYMVGDEKKVPYNVKKSLALALYCPELKLGARALLDNDRLAMKIEAAEGVILLEEKEYEQVMTAIDSISGFDRQDVEFVRRVVEAQTVDVVEKT